MPPWSTSRRPNRAAWASSEWLGRSTHVRPGPMAATVKVASLTRRQGRRLGPAAGPLGAPARCTHRGAGGAANVRARPVLFLQREVQRPRPRPFDAAGLLEVETSARVPGVIGKDPPGIVAPVDASAARNNAWMARSDAQQGPVGEGRPGPRRWHSRRNPEIDEHDGRPRARSTAAPIVTSSWRPIQ